MRNLREAEVSGKRIFVRADFNVPITSDKITDDFRIKKSFQTIDYLLKNGAKIILASHIEGESKTLLPVYEYLKTKYKIVFVEDYFPNIVDLEPYFSDGYIVLLENLRKYEGEKANDDVFAKSLSELADVYVNEAFPASHRNHASIVKIPKLLPGFAGFVFEDEVKELSKAFHPEHPFLFVLGGAKFDTKLPIIEKFFNIADTIFIGGALANDFYKARGIHTGTSLLSGGNIDVSKFLTGKIILPMDVRVTNDKGVFVKKPNEILPEDCIVDVGPASIESLSKVINEAQFILWNGPLGNYEIGFKDATLSLAGKIAEGKAISMVGGGDTIASIAELKLSSKFSFISTGGGAMLDFLANETLPGIEALSNN